MNYEIIIVKLIIGDTLLGCTQTRLYTSCITNDLTNVLNKMNNSSGLDCTYYSTMSIK